MALSADALNQNKTTSRILNKLNYAFANDAADITTAATDDVIPFIDKSDNYNIKYGDAANVGELIAGSTISSLTVTTLTTTTQVVTGRKLITPVCGNAKVGATAGWVITAGTDKYSATLPAAQTNSTLVIPIQGLNVGDTVTAVAVVGQVESGGNAAAATVDVRKLTAAAADLTDASLGTDTMSVTADTKLDDGTGLLKVSGLTEVMNADEQLYVLLTGTTAAATDLDIQALVITVTTGS